MKFTQIRNATIKIDYAGKTLLFDPFLADKGTIPGYPATVNNHIRNPTVELPMSMNDIFDDVDAVIVTHTHPDHWDDAAQKLVPQDTLIFARDAVDEWQIQLPGFRNTRALKERNDYEGITMTKTPGQHGRGQVLEGAMGEILGRVCGVVLQHSDEPTVYIAGDTVWYEGVAETLKQHTPDVIVLNSADARLLPNEPIIMGKQDVYEVYHAAPQATLIASHMEAVNLATLSRKELGEFLSEQEMVDRVRIPDDGESYRF